MSDVLVKFQGGQCQATSCGSKNSIVAMMASAMLTEMNQFSVAQTNEVQVQGLGVAMSGTQLG